MLVVEVLVAVNQEEHLLMEDLVVEVMVIEQVMANQEELTKVAEAVVEVLLHPHKFIMLVVPEVKVLLL